VRAVIDTSVWVSALLNPDGFPAQVLRAYIAGQFTLVTSEPLLSELLDVLGRPRITARLQMTAAEKENLVELLLERAVLAVLRGELQLCRDAEDDAVIETAVLGGAGVIVSRDEDVTRDPALSAALAEAGVRPLTVAQFLAELPQT
jgi:putative PIN family toxin of toxin-antitoxin system